MFLHRRGRLAIRVEIDRGGRGSIAFVSPEFVDYKAEDCDDGDASDDGACDDAADGGGAAA